MRNCVAVLLVVALCGCERSEAEVRREQAQAGLNALVGAIMSQDPTRLKSVLSRDQIEIVQRRADGAGETFDATLLLEYAPQKRGLILNFGEEWLAKNVIEVSEVRDRGDALFEISTSFNGDPKYGKPVYFSLEGDDF